MEHYGDITKLNGHELPIVDIITGGSPCQDLSVAGKRAGLAGERSGLFMEQIRIIEEMRDECRTKANGGANVDIRPRFMVWENVCGAFSSNNGEDFRAVLEETAKIADKNAVIPRPTGKWTPSGCIMGNGWSIAWRVHDAQFWGVPQRRKRISLVADFAGGGAPEILFERKSVCGDSTESAEQREKTSRTIGNCIAPTSGAISFLERAGCAGGGKGILIQNEKTGTLSTFNNQSVFCLQGNGIDCSNNAGCEGKGWRENQLYTLNTMDRHAVCCGFDAYNQAVTGDVTKPLTSIATDSDHTPVVYSIGHDIRSSGLTDDEITDPLTATDYKDPIKITSNNSVVRRLTPMECERLQGFPDGWTDIGEWVDSKGKKHKDSDSPRYKALGNSIALPFWQWMAGRIIALYDRPTTMASLFDGIGGFPLVFSRCGCKPIWTSEIEEFPIAVTKIRFPENAMQEGTE